MANARYRPFMPDYAVPPGESLKESLEFTGMTQAELAERTGLSRKTVNGIINAKEPITWDSAIQFEKVFRTPAQFWINFQNAYEAALARLKDHERLEAYKGWLKEMGIPVKDLEDRGAIPDVLHPGDKLRAVLNFFGVASPEEFAIIWQKTAAVYDYRKSGKLSASLGAVAAWLRLGELEAAKIQCGPFDRRRFEATINAIRDRMADGIPACIEPLTSQLADCGVALVLVPGIKGAPIHGATRWLTPSKVLIQMSLRGKDDGHFWFTLFHEFAHILLHGKKEIFLELDHGKETGKEREADEWACDRLIPREDFRAFLHMHDGKGKDRPRISKNSIVSFAKRVAVPPGVVVGRLQHEGRLPHAHCNDLKVRLNFTGKPCPDPNLIHS